MNETGVLGHFIRAFGKIVSMMQFNMYHHYTVDEHLLRCVGYLQDIERGGNDEFIVASDLMRKIRPEHRAVIYITTLLHDIAKGRPEDHSIAGAKVARRLCPRLGFNAADTELIAWLIEQHLTMSTVAQSRDLSDRKTIENFAAVVQSVEQMKLLTILTTADIRGVGPGVWNGWKAQLLRTLYYETEPVLTGGFSEVNRAQRIAVAQSEFRAAFTEWPEARTQRLHLAALSRPTGSRSNCRARSAMPASCSASEQAGHKLAINVGFDEARGVTELTILAIDHPWLLSIIAGACASAGANIVDAQIYTTTDGRALDTIAISREYDRDEDEGRRATRIGEMIEDVLEGKLRLPEVVARRAAGRGKARPFVVEPEVIINNQWSDRYTVIEVSGLDRPGLLYQLTTAISKLNLNIASAHVATFGERARDVFYVTDLLGAQINAPTRQAAIKSALIHLLANDETLAQPAA